MNIKIKILIVFYVILTSVVTVGQNSIFLKEKDTLFITYDISLLDKGLIEIEYKNTYLKNQPMGLVKIYNLLTPAEKVKKEQNKEKSRENRVKLNRNNPSGYNLNSYKFDIEIGFKFVHSSKKINYQSYVEENKYLSSLKNTFFDNKGKIDSLKIDKLLYNRYRTLESATTALILDESIKFKKNIFRIDGSESQKEKLKNIIDQPIYIFILDRVIINEDESKSYIFNEVVLKNKIGDL